MSNDSGKFAEKIGVYVATGGHAVIGAQNIGGQKQLRPFQAPPLPTYYVDRPEYSQDLKTVDIWLFKPLALALTSR